MSDTIAEIDLIDAATNCERDSAEVTLILRSGVQLRGSLRKPQRPKETITISHNRGRSVVLLEEVAAMTVAPSF